MRLNFSVVLIVTLLALTEDVASPQQPQRVHRIGWIAFDGSRPNRDFMTRLRELGYIDGQSITVEFRSAQGSEKRLSEIAAELVRIKPNVIVAAGNDATDAARKATTTIPIVFKHGDPIWDGAAGSLAQPGKNLTGLSEIAFDLAGKRLELLRDAFPKIFRVAVLLDADAPVHRRQLADMEKVGQALGVQLQALKLQNSKLDFDSLFRRAISERANALLVLPNPAVFCHRTRVLEFAAKNRLLAAIYPDSAYANAGGLMSYGVDCRELNRCAAYYVDRILEGAKRSDLPVEQPTKFEFGINLNTANALGLTIPSKVLTWADRVISDGGQVPERNAATSYPSDVRRTARIPRIGILSAGSDNPAFNAFREGLLELGWVEGQNIAIEYRWGEGDEDRIPALAAELVSIKVDVIVATTARGARAAQQLTKNIPIIATFVGTTLVKSLAHPEGNVTGLSSMSPELGGKRLELLKEIIPRISRVAVLANVVDPAQATSIKEIDAVAWSLGVQLQILNVKKTDEIENAFSSMVRGKVGALIVLTPAMFVLNRARIVGLAAKSRLPAMYPDSRFTDAGGLMSYGPNNAELYRRAAYYVDKILKGAKPAELPVEQPTKFELVINLKTAKQLNLAILPKVLTWSDRVIE